MEELILLSQIFRNALAPVVAIVTVYIAIQQWNTNRLKLKFELYHKRFEIYNNVKVFMIKINEEAKIDKRDLCKFRNSLAETEFLFKRNRKLMNYLNLIDKKALNLYANKNDDTELLLWFSDQHKELIKLFGEYLDVSKI